VTEIVTQGDELRECRTLGSTRPGQKPDRPDLSESSDAGWGHDLSGIWG